MDALELAVIIPVYNEQDAIERVIQEWIPVFRHSTSSFRIYLINDGSKDQTPDVLDRLAKEFPELRVIHRTNHGHGPSCLFGYQRALADGAVWVFQIDSDGQCDPRYFERFWDERKQCPLVFGFRARRDDGFSRVIVSRVLRGVIAIAGHRWIRDANVPYRLIRKDLLQSVIARIPSDFSLANILLSYLLCLNQTIRWIPIRFRERMGGTSTVKPSMLIRSTGMLFREIRLLRKTAG